MKKKNYRTQKKAKWAAAWYRDEQLMKRRRERAETYAFQCKLEVERREVEHKEELKWWPLP